ncbi:hypothetical protein BDV11DRAFT_173088 [Aspergillus similis]
MGQLPASTETQGANLESDHPHMVDFNGPDDKDTPLSWSFPWKIWVTVASVNLIGTVASSIFETGNEEFRREFGISHEVAVHTPDGVYIPESRLPPMIVGGIMVPIGMFWFAWTASPLSISSASPICASFMTGCGMYLLFIHGFNYIIDCYTSMANSAMGVNESMRSVFGAVFPLFASQMVGRLGVAKTTSILGGVCSINSCSGLLLALGGEDRGLVVGECLVFA